MPFKTIDPEIMLKALEGHENILDKEVEAHEEYFRKLSCINCGSNVTPFVDPSRLFRDGQNLPNYLARCETCKCEFEPYTKIEVKGPDWSDPT